MGGSKRCSVNFFVGALVGKFGVEKPVLDAFFPPGVCGSILIGLNWDDSVADNRFLQISSISFFKNLMAL